MDPALVVVGQPEAAGEDTLSITSIGHRTDVRRLAGWRPTAAGFS